jgi:hypothetical protein
MVSDTNLPLSLRHPAGSVRPAVPAPVRRRAVPVRPAASALRTPTPPPLVSQVRMGK